MDPAITRAEEGYLTRGHTIHQSSTLSNSERVVYGWDIEIVLLLMLSLVHNNILGLWPIRQFIKSQ